MNKFWNFFYEFKDFFKIKFYLTCFFFYCPRVVPLRFFGTINPIFCFPCTVGKLFTNKIANSIPLNDRFGILYIILICKYYIRLFEELQLLNYVTCVIHIFYKALINYL